MRTIRSFVRRTGRVTASQARALELLWPQYGVDDDGQMLVPGERFARTAPLVLEIGFGNGETFVKQAAADPGRNYLGIEVHEPGIGHCLIKAQEAGIDNLRIIAHDAVEVLQTRIASGSLARLNLYFPDPWPKKRHHKRRIVQDAFVELVADRLEHGGSWYLATDWANYAEHIDEVLGRAAAFSLVERREHDGEAPLERPQTKFERRGLRKGHRIVDWHFRKTG